MGWGMNSGGGGSGRNGGASSSVGGWGPSVGMNDGGFMSAEGNNFGGWTGGLDRGLSSSMGEGGGVSGRGMTAQQERGLLGVGMGGMFFSNPQEVSRHYQQVDYANRQKRIKEAAAARRAAEARDLAGINSLAKRGAISAADYGKALNAHNTGDLNAIEGVTGKRSAMRDTHNSGGIFGGMFGLTGDDVQTMDEANSKLGPVDPNNPMGTAPLGFAGLTIAPGVAKVVGLQTQSLPAAQLTNKGIGTVSKAVGPNLSTAQKATGGLLSLAGGPGGQLSQALGLMGRAADLNYAGYIGSPNAPTPASRNDSNWYWRYIGGLLA